MRIKGEILHGCALCAILLSGFSASAALAQESGSDTATGTTTDDTIVVVGIRGSVEAAADHKRTSKQIVDSIVAEDVGKLPDNNVPEALSRVTGVQIDRARGSGQGVTIRGLSEIQTTINGNQTNLGDGRSMNLADIPAELLKQVDVYKTRTADQVEGGIAGTVNVQLRRPMDMKKGWTVAGSMRGSYDNQSEKISPYASLLVANRFETGIGEIGFLVNGSWTRTNYFENFIDSESPNVVCCEGNPSSPFYNVPAGFEQTVIPYRAQYGVEQGRTTRPSINAVLQWKASDTLDFVLEGGYIGSRENRAYDRTYILTREGGSRFSNMQLMPDGKTIRSMTVSNPNGLPAGIDGQYTRLHSNLYTSNLEAHWRGEKAQINVSAQFNKSDEGYYFVEQILRPRGLTSATIDFASDQYGGGIPAFRFDGIDLTDVSTYGVDRFQDNKGGSNNKEFITQADITLQLSDQGFLRSFQSGLRYNTRKTNRYYGYRDGFPRVGGQPAPFSMFPGAGSAELVGPNFSGVDSLSWYRVPGSVVMDKIADIRSFIQVNDPRNAARWSSEFPPSDRGQTFDSSENNFSMFGQFNYGFDIGIPVEGTFGLRYVNTWGTSTSYNYRPGDESNNFQDIVEVSPGRGNYTDLLPSFTTMLRFDPRTQLRMSFTTNVQRSSFYDMRPFFFAETRATPPVIFAGNPDLKAQRERAFDISAEHYFGRGGQISLAGYYKKATGFLYYSREAVSDLGRYGLPGQSGFVEQMRNAGDGTFFGVEGTVQSFFDFLPGFWRNFGASLNASHIIKARVEYPYEEDFPGAFDSPNTSKWTANAALYYDTPKFSTRVAMNYRSAYRIEVWTDNPAYSPYQDNTFRLDAAMNYTPVEWLTLSLEGSNLLNNNAYRYFGRENLLPKGVRTLARTVQASARFRF